MPTAGTAPAAAEANAARAAKTFVILGGYTDIRRALLDRKWVELDDAKSHKFDLKWTTKAKDVNHAVLRDNQKVNHFKDAHKALTTKVGLANHLNANAKWVDSLDANRIFPRSYDLSERADYRAFIADFLWGAAEGALKRVVRDNGLCEHGVPTRGVVELALRVAEAKIAYNRYLRVDDGSHGGTDDGADGDVECEDEAPPMLPPELQEADFQAIYNCPHFTACEPAPDKHASKAAVKARAKRLSANAAKETAAVPLEASLMERATEAVRLLADTTFWPQATMDGERNVWIVKPAGKSRGRGIKLFNHLDALRHYLAHGSYMHDDDDDDDETNEAAAPAALRQRTVEKAASLQAAFAGANPEGGSEQWVAQRYIERPLVVHGRKFDIRQWVLVTDWDPLTAWMHSDCYIRLCAEDYDIEDLNKFKHLSNNSIAKHSKEHKANYVGSHNMLSRKEFTAHLAAHVPGADASTFDNVIYPRIKRIVTASLRCAIGTIEPRAGSFELYGYDFTVDEDLNTWLLEVNSSPSLEHSTEVTTKAVRNMCEDLVKVVVDLPEAAAKYRKRRGKHATEHGPESPVADAQHHGVDTGAWECVLKADHAGSRLAVWSTDLCLKGTAIDWKTPEIIHRQQEERREFREAERERHRERLQEIAAQVKESRVAKEEAERSERNKTLRRRRKIMLELAAKRVARLESERLDRETNDKAVGVNDVMISTVPIARQDMAIPTADADAEGLFPVPRRLLRPISCARKPSEEAMERIRAHAERQRMSRMVPPWIRRMQAIGQRAEDGSVIEKPSEDEAPAPDAGVDAAATALPPDAAEGLLVRRSAQLAARKYRAENQGVEEGDADPMSLRAPKLSMFEKRKRLLRASSEKAILRNSLPSIHVTGDELPLALDLLSVSTTTTRVGTRNQVVTSSTAFERDAFANLGVGQLAVSTQSFLSKSHALGQQRRGREWLGLRLEAQRS